ncbi:MAG TPA: hypothetical protein ENN34_10635 [Deltaproteobacteria bacterium]|nr:hypothetical protein [Deltaproteobacteria bacterium]
MEVHVETRDILEMDPEVLGLWFFSDERPLKGLTGLVDWRLEAKLSHLIMSGFLSGDYGEKTLMRPAGELPRTALLFIGLGGLNELIPERVRKAGELMARTAVLLCRESLCVSLPGSGITGMNIVSSAEHMLAGFAQEIGERRFLLKVHCAPEDVDEAVLGFQKTKVSMKTFLHTKIIQEKS